VVVYHLDEDRIDQAGCNDYARERRARQRIRDRCRGEVALPLRRREHHRRSRPFDDRPLAFVIQHEKCLVLADRAGKDRAELIAAKNVLRKRLWAEIATGIERVVPEELEQRAVILISSGPE